MNRNAFDPILDDLDDVEGQGTQLISLYIPPEKGLQSVVQRLQSEQAESENIKSKSTRQGVQRALTLAINELYGIDGMPENGIVVFAGVDRDGDEYAETIAPSHPVDSFVYHCDSEFRTEDLREIEDDRTLFGLIVAERRAGTVGLLRGDTVEHVATTSSDAQGKHSAGGFSQKRFERLEEEWTADFFLDLLDIASDAFDRDEIEGIVIGGSSVTREKFQDVLPTWIDDAVIGSFPTEYHGEEGLIELVDRSQDVIADRAGQMARTVVTDFKEAIREEDRHVRYGLADVEHASELGAVDTLLVSTEKRRYEPIQELIENVEGKGGETVIVPDTGDIGQQFEQGFGGIGAICRFDPGRP